jgi:hypothetical protein
VIGSIDLNLRAEKNSVAYFNIIAIQENTIEIRKKIVPHFNMGSVIAKKWRLYINVSACFAEQRF